jgi:hypothetical protein
MVSVLPETSLLCQEPLIDDMSADDFVVKKVTESNNAKIIFMVETFKKKNYD